MSELDEVVREFIVESQENLGQMEEDMVALEEKPNDSDILSRIFRTIHTIKGTCGFLGYHKLESITHVGENLLSKLRDKELVLDKEITTVLLQMVDAVQKLLSEIEQTGTEGDGNYDALVESIDQQLSKDQKASLGRAEHTESVKPKETEPEQLETETSHAQSVKQTSETEQIESVEEVEKPQPTTATQTTSKEKTLENGSLNKGSLIDSNVRVSVEVLDDLMNLVGELVLARNQVLQFTANNEDSAFVATSQRLNLVTSEIQEKVMKTRMQPIKKVWSKFPRVVRDLSIACGKKIQIEMEGEDTELDKTLIEAVKDPLTHLVRNTVDHGIEPPKKRIENGKEETGTLLLRAFHEGGQVIIEITDDGGGIDAQKIKNKAMERGLISQEQASQMTEQDAVQLIFLPGFSTAPKITNVSGRGVGMDVVKTNIERIGGNIDVQTTLEKGTTFRMRIPLTLAIIPALTVKGGSERFAIPQINLLELVRLEDASKQIENIRGTRVYRLRGNLLPLINLNDTLQLESQSSKGENDTQSIVVVQAEGNQFGIIVDEVQDTEEIVVKPLGTQLKGIGTYAGATIMGDGCVALILDIPGIARHEGISQEQSKLREKMKEENKTAQSDVDKELLLLFEAGQNRTLALPLSSVSRLEEFEVEAFEKAGNHQVIQYRDDIMPLLDISAEVFGDQVKTNTEHEKQHVIVHKHEEQRVGLMVTRIVDIVEESIQMKHVGKRHGIVGSAVVNGSVVEFLDAESLISTTVL